MFYRRQGWFEFGLASIVLRLQGEVAWKHNVGVANREMARLPMILDVNGVWETFIPLEANDPDNEDELRKFDINRDLSEFLKSGSLRYSIQCSHTNRRIRGSVAIEDDFLKE